MDSRITQREVMATKEWLSSDLDFHIMRDHEQHGYITIPGGMWSACLRHDESRRKWRTSWFFPGSQFP